ncbi:chitin synthase-domain-containing protein [Paraphysoderma sedebokerense]|nr:chitin synthase-domain-containing protein [Paraphysoderma sedebokerense]
MVRQVLDPITGREIPNTLAYVYYPGWVLVILQIFFWITSIMFLLYLICHYIVHSWSFFEIARLGMKEISDAKEEIESGKQDLGQSKLQNLPDSVEVPAYYRISKNKLSHARQRVCLAMSIWAFYSAAMVIVSLLSFLFLSFGSTASGWINFELPLIKNPEKFRNDYLAVFYGVYVGPPILIAIISIFKLVHSTVSHRMYQKKKAETLPSPVSHSVESFKAYPNVIILVPTYKEPLPNILSTINAIAASDYPKDRIHVYLGFDELEVQETIFTLTRLLSGEGFLEHASPIHSDEKAMKYNGLAQLRSFRNSGSSLGDGTNGPATTPMSTDCPLVTSLMYNGISLQLCRFPHGGKLSVQKYLYELISTRIPEVYPVDSYVLFIDSDTTVLPNTVSTFIDHFRLNPKELAATGFIVSRNGHGSNFWQQYQDAEYIFMQLGSRCAEAALGGVTCLPGALTIVYYPLLTAVATQYFNQPPIDSTFEFCRRKLGEDRYMTHLIMEYTSCYKVGFEVNAICKTEAPGNFYNLLRQRRRWTLGSFANEVYILCTPRFYYTFPALILLRIYQTLRLGGAIFYIFILELIFTSTFSASPNIKEYILIFSVPFLYWLIVAIWAFTNKRWKVSLWVLAYFIGNLVFESVWLWYSLWTVREKVWGGPRADAKPEGEEEHTEDIGEDQTLSEMSEVEQKPPMEFRVSNIEESR